MSDTSGGDAQLEQDACPHAGRKYEGQFRAGHRTGRGIATNANGKKLKGGIWENGQLVVRVTSS